MRYNIKIKSHTIIDHKTIYVIQVTDDQLDHPYILRYRYSQLRNIHLQLLKMIQKIKLDVVLPTFPGRKLFGVTNKSQETVLERQKQLNSVIIYYNKYLNQLFSVEKLFSLNIFQDSFISHNSSQEVFQSICNSQQKIENNFQAEIDGYILVENVVFYYFKIIDLKYSSQWIFKTRYSDLRKVHEALERTKIMDLPSFPKRKIFGVTNNNPENIQRRKQELKIYFNKLFKNKQVLNSEIIHLFLSESKKQAQVEKQLERLMRQNTKKQR